MKLMRPDEYFNNGMIEMSRFGDTLEVINHNTDELQKQVNEVLARRYDEEVSQINKLVDDIRARIKKADPYNLINYVVTMNQLVEINKITERDYSDDETFQLRSLEYVQSVLVSTPARLMDTKKEEVQEDVLFGEILKLTTELYKRISMFIISWAAKEEEEGKISNEDLEYIVYFQMMSMVRGKQYQIFRMPILYQLLEPQADIFQEIYGVTIDELIEGLTQLEKNLSSGRVFAMKQFAEQMDKVIINDKGGYEGIDEGECAQLVEDALGLQLFNVKEVTRWPLQLIKDLSLKTGEDKSFFSHEIYNGWPIWNLPIQFKPIISINKDYFCFDYYTVFDNFYRSLQKAVSTHGEEFSARWNQAQGKATENLVGDIFNQLLPGCSIHISNFYPIKGNNSAENDIIVEYKDVLIIAEVKAGGFTYTPAITDYPAHKASLKSLVEKAEAQCIRVRDYIESAEQVPFYYGDSLQEVSFSIKREKYTQIYMFDVTVSGFNELAAQMEKVHITNTKEDIITISIDDLWVYKAYFDSPLVFIHYLKQRMLATRAKSLVLSDELDHLGLYIHRNMYSKGLDNEGVDHIIFDGFREDIDRYFAMQNLSGEVIEKPKQEIPWMITKIIQLCEHKDSESISKFTNFLLDMDSESREKLCDSILYIHRREFEIQRMFPVITFGECEFAVFVKRPDVQNLSVADQQRYIMATIAYNKNSYCYWIELETDRDLNILDINYRFISQDDIHPSERDVLVSLGSEYAKKRIQSFLMKNNKKKMSRNDPCPCGSGQKYKNCCGKN